nr:hypothetical protein [Tanacetum cinerariifolium]
MDLLSFIRTADPTKGASGDCQGTDIQPVIATTNTIVEELALLQPRRKKLKEDYGALGGAFAAGKSSHADSVTGLNLRTIDAPQRFVISSYSSHHSGANIAKTEVDSIVRSSAPAIATVTTVTAAVDAVTTADRVPVEPSLFGVSSSSTSRTDSILGGFSDVSGSDFLIGGIRTILEPDSDLQKVYVPQWSVTNGFGLDDNRICHEMLDEFAPLKFFASVYGMDHDRLFTEFNVRAAHQISLSVEVRMCAEYNIIEKKRLRYVVDEQAELLKREKNELSVKVTNLSASMKVKEHEVTDLDTQAIAVKLQNDNLVDRVHELEISSAKLQEKVAAYKDFIGQLEKFQDEKMEVNEKFDKLCANFVDMALHLEEKFYPHLLTTIFGRRWLLALGMKLAIIRCLNSAEYMYALGAAVSKVVEKGMQEELSAGITHGAKDRKLADVTAYNPSAKADYLSALQRLQNVNFSLIAELKSNKDASVDIIRNLFRLDDALAESASALSLSLDVSHSRVRKIRENIASHVSAHRDVFVPLSEPLSAMTLEGMKEKRKDVTNESSADTNMEDASNQERMIVDLDRDEGIALMDDERAEKKLKMLSMQEDEPKVQEVVEVVTTAKLITEVVAIVSESVSAASATIAAVHAATITAAPVRVATASTRRRKGVVIRDPEEESTAKKPVETKSKDKGKGIMVEEPKPIKKKQQVEMDKTLDYFKGMSYDDIHPICEAKFNSNIEFLLKTKDKIEEEENRAIKSINETPAQKAAKRRKINEDVEDLKQHLEIVSDEDDDVYT